MKVIGRKGPDGKNLEIPEGLNYAEFLKAIGGGVAACGDHLGTLVSEPENAKNCPAGWMFVDVNTPAEKIKEAMDDISQNGRSKWPTK